MRCSIPEEVQKEMEGCGGLAELLRKQPAKKALKEASKKFSLLSKPVRLRILLLLRHGALCVCIIKAAVSYPDSKLSYHLACLKRAGFIRSRRDRSYLRYSLTEKGHAVADEILRMLDSE
jgi:ArsR family transcriptional regulator